MGIVIFIQFGLSTPTGNYIKLQLSFILTQIIILSFAQKTVSALSYTLINFHAPGRTTSSPQDCNRVVDFLFHQQERNLDYIRLPLLVFTVLFGLSSLPRHPVPFHRLPDSQRLKQVDRWRRSFFAPCRNWILFYESLVVLRLFSIEEPGSGQ